MIISAEKYQGIPYVFENGPLVVPTLEVARNEGANCQVIPHFVLGDLGIKIPPDMRSSEITLDRDWSRLVDYRNEPVKGGDVFIFGAGKDPREYHSTIHTGTVDSSGQPRLLHLNYQDNGVTVWSLDQFKKHARYAELKAVKRFINP